MLTGEATPIAREEGGRVLAGTLNYDGAVICRAESLGEDTVLAQITRMVEQAQSSRAPTERLADRASSIFVPIVLLLAAATFIGWYLFGGSISLALANTVSVLVIACPCAMGLAVPAALTVAVGRGAQLGLLYKGGEALERMANLKAIVIDKTGTAWPVGRPVLQAVRPGERLLRGRFASDRRRRRRALESPVGPCCGRLRSGPGDQMGTRSGSPGYPGARTCRPSRRLRLPYRQRSALPGTRHPFSRYHSSSPARYHPPMDSSRSPVDWLFRCARFPASGRSGHRGGASQEGPARHYAHG